MSTPAPTMPRPASAGTPVRPRPGASRPGGIAPQEPSHPLLLAEPHDAGTRRRRAFRLRYDGHTPAVAILLVLVAQAALTLSLRNTAFQDEALYIYAGHRELLQWMHGTSTYDNYASYFSGAPFFYPVLAGLMDAAGGLWAVRALSLLFMLGATWCLYRTTRTWFGAATGVLAAVVFGLSAPVLFMGGLATYDALALFCLSAALLLVTRRYGSWRGALLGVVCAAVAIDASMTAKYASALFVPSLFALALLAGIQRHGWLRGIATTALLGVLTLGGAFAVVRSSHGLWTGIRTTTSQRALGADSVHLVLGHSLRWIGLPLALALVGGVLLVLGGHHDERDVEPGTGSRAVLALGLLATGLLVPVHQAQLHTAVSLQKHVGFGLLFVAPLAGVALRWLLRTRVFWRAGVTGVLALALGGTALISARSLYREWPNSNELVQVLRDQVRPVTGHYLAEEPEVPRYYLRDLVQPYQWTGTYFFEYDARNGQHLVGVPAYKQAIAERYFDVVVLRYGPTAGLDHEIDTDLVAGKGYHLIARPQANSSFGQAHWWVWQRD